MGLHHRVHTHLHLASQWALMLDNQTMDNMDPVQHTGLPLVVIPTCMAGQTMPHQDIPDIQEVNSIQVAGTILLHQALSSPHSNPE